MTSSPAGAAFIDLDRTLLVGASGAVLSRTMRAAGVVGWTIPGESLLYAVFERVGENLPSMMLARQAVRLARGRSRAAVQRAGEEAADDLVALVQPLASGMIDEHRRAGRPVVLATTTPYDLVAPFAARLGLDDVIATRYAVDADGRYDGNLDGPFVWSTGKLAAVREWATRHGVELDDCYAYSDSVFDTPLLSAVGHPVVVNPDPRMRLVAAGRRWPIVDLGGQGGLGLGAVGELPRRLVSLVHPAMFPYARFDIDGVEHIPPDGPAIVVANHRSYFDVAAMAVMLARTGRPVRFLGKREVFDAPIIGALAHALGGIPVDRASGSDEPLRAAEEALGAGELVAMMPQGTIPRGAALYEPVLRGRWGAARLAKATRAPVIPVGLWGTEHVWPRAARLPQVLAITDPPLVTVRGGAPVALVHRSLDADTRRIMTAIMNLLPPESRLRRQPTDAEIAAATPPGRNASASPEVTRRPGTD